MTVAGMKYSLIPRENRVLIYQYLINEGVLVCKKSSKVPVHPEINVPNLHVMMVCKSLKSRNYVVEHYNWQHLYFVLTDQGVEYLRTYLYLPPTVFPATHSKRPTSNVILKEVA
ncbi:40S ribosomal protein S10-A [Babesia sp. Xinjiang]|uniref:40S ribosomal protein S10-A n=1 Tax=Babesia sp. Xinjiang TaxID=462227 RepID=UPI000A21F24C|nr:40S ribosomal protein S10-A [Babesia sp. Xinjiang]ORM39931.1 40S ribosomal protein S10-A [Babesia sp. Xinjiang]